MNSLYKNSALYLTATISLRAASFLLVPFYSYLISPAEYGYVYIVTSFMTFMSLFVTCSLHGAVNRFYFSCETKGDVQKMFSTITLLVVFTSLLISSLLFWRIEEIAEWINLPVVYLKIAIISSVLLCFYKLITSLLYAKQEAKKMSLTSIATGLGQIVLQLIMVLNMDDKAMAMILSQLIGAIMIFVLFIIYSHPYLRLKFDIHRAWTYFKYSVCRVPSDVSVWLVGFSDRIMMNKMKGSAMTGIYGMGQTLGSVPKIVYASINSAYIPFVFNSYKEIDKGNNAKMEELKRHTTFIFSIITVLVTIIIVLSNNVVALLNERYSQASVVMAFMLFAMLIDCYRTMFMPPLEYNVKYMKWLSSIWCLAAALNIGLNLYLIPRYNIYGACFSMIFSYVTTFGLITFFARKARPVKYETKTMIHVFVVSMIACLMMFLGTSWLLLPIKGLGILVYGFIIMRILKVDIKTLLNSIKRIK